MGTTQLAAWDKDVDFKDIISRVLLMRIGRRSTEVSHWAYGRPRMPLRY